MSIKKILSAKPRKPRLLLAGLGCMLTLFSISGALSAQPSEQLAEMLQLGQNKAAKNRQSQATVDKLAKETSKLVIEYQQLLKDVEGLKVYNKLQRHKIKKQRELRKNYERSIREVKTMQRQIPSVAVNMLNTLEEFIELDMPFYLEERRARIRQVRANFESPNISIAEKYRQILEAYSIEINEYGRKISSYKDTIPVDGASREVNMLQVGRIALLYQTTDGKKTGMWDQQGRQWVELSSRKYRTTTKQALRIARKQAAIDLIKLPIPAAERL